MEDCLFVIPARGGSKGIPGKNIKPLNGKPLIQYSVECARALTNDENICVSTDSLQIEGIVREIGLKVPFIRPPALASDTAGSYEVLLHAINFYKNIGRNFKTLILLQPTSPFRKPSQIIEAYQIFLKDKPEMVVSVCQAKSNPYYVMFEEREGNLHPLLKQSFTRRQDCPDVWEFNGAIYIYSIEALESKHSLEFSNIKKYVMTDVDSIDIDTPLDWQFAEFMMQQTHQTI